MRNDPLTWSGADVKRWHREVCARYEIGDDLKRNDLRVYVKMLERYPTPGKAKNISHVRVGLNAGGHRCLYIYRLNGEKDSAGQSRLASRKERSMRKLLMCACREAVAETQVDFKGRNRKSPCEKCGTRSKKRFMHADHKPPHTFIAIFNAWCEEHQIEYDDERFVRRYLPPSEFVRPVHGPPRFAFLEAADHFRAFHDARVEYRILCASCHLRQAK